jgi:hypothetical protein
MLALAALATMGVDRAQQTRDTMGPQGQGTAAISGSLVTDEQTPRPVRRALLTLTPAEDGGRPVFTHSDDTGRFRFADLAAGRFVLGASKAPFLDARYGAKRPGGAPTPITLAAGQQLNGVTLRMSPGAVLSGRIQDHNGEPAYGVSVRALQVRMRDDQRSLVTVDSGSAPQTTDDRGVYRLFGLPPGEYVIRAVPRTPDGEMRATTDSESDADRVTVALAPVFYPGVTSAAAAQPVTLSVGEERGGLDFGLRLVRTTTVEGVVVVPSEIEPQNVQLLMLPVGGDAQPDAVGLVSVGRDGRFRRTAVSPGQYTLSARATLRLRGAADSESSIVVPFWASTDLSVSGAPVTVTLTMQPSMTFSGRIEFRSRHERSDADFKSVMLNLLQSGTGGPIVRIGSTPLEVDRTGRFTISGVVPGRYRLDAGVRPTLAFGPGSPWRIGSAVVKGLDVLDFPLEVLPHENITDAVVTFVDYEQTISGVFQDASGRPAPEYTIVVFPADRRYWLPGSRRVRWARPATDGRYSIRGLPPGEYRMAAVTDLLPSNPADSAFLDQLVAPSFTLTIADGENKTQDLRIAGGSTHSQSEFPHG